MSTLIPPEIFHHHIFRFLDSIILKKSISPLSREHYEWVNGNVISLVLNLNSPTQKKVIFDCASCGSFRNIKNLVLKNVSGGIKGLFVEDWKSLVSLSINYGKLDSEDIEEICSLPNLTSLNLRKNEQEKYTDFTHVTKLKNLTKLNLSENRIGHWCKSFVENAPNGLKALILSECSVYRDDLNLIGSLSSLETLDLLSYYNRETIEVLDKWNMPSLTNLNIECLLFSKVVKDICKLSSLKVLNMSSCSIQNEKDWELISLHLFPNLTSLNASKNKFSISWLKHSAPNLTSLNISNCGINDSDLTQLFSGLVPLVSIIDISGNHITDEGILAISESPYSSNLRSITCICINTNFTVLSDKSLQHISCSTFMENLTFINFTGNQISGEGLITLGNSNIKNLKILKLCRTRITHESFRQFMKCDNMKRLTEIDFSNAISPNMAICRQAFPYLRRLNRASVTADGE